MNKIFVLNNKKGFTLLEVLLSITLITILTAFASPLLQFFQVRNSLGSSTITVAQTLRRAQFLSQAIDGDTTWGVKIQTGSIVLFKGASYATRDTGYDETYDMDGTITPSGQTEVVFAKFSGVPNVTGTITLTSSNAEIKNITINSKGMIDY